MSLKRLVAPNWPIEKKTKKFVVEPKPGPHSSRKCIPLGVIVRDMLKYGRTMSEVRIILNAGNVKINGVVRKEKGFPVGLMDTLSMGDEHYRVTVDKKGLMLAKIKSAEAGTRLLRIDNKINVKGKKTQLNFHDGSNMNSTTDAKTGDVVVIDIEKNSIKEIVKLEKGMMALVIGGNSMGMLGKVAEIIVNKSSMTNQVAVDIGDKRIRLPRNYIFVVGKNEPVVSIART